MSVPLGHNAGGIEVALARAGKHVIREALRTLQYIRGNIYAEQAWSTGVVNHGEREQENWSSE